MILKHRDTEVLRFEWLEPEGVHVTSVNEAARSFLPLAFPGGVTTAMKAAAMKLNGLRFKRHPHYNLSAQRLSMLEDFQRVIAKLKKQGTLALVGTGRVKSWKVIKAIAYEDYRALGIPMARTHDCINCVSGGPHLHRSPAPACGERTGAFFHATQLVRARRVVRPV